MARPGLRAHPKFRRLVAMLRMPEAHVLGHLEMLWETAYEVGEDIGDTLDVELAAGWVGEQGLLCKCLATCSAEGKAGFIEETPEHPGRYRIHDLYDHAPQYVQRRMEREAQRLNKGQTISDIRRAAVAQRKDRKDKQTATNDFRLNTENNKRLQIDSTPSPSPSTKVPSPNGEGCTEPDTPASLPPSPAVIFLPCTGTGTHEVGIQQAQVGEWTEAFPGVDVPQQLRSMRAWLIANPTKRKTARGIPAFVVRWLGKEQNRGAPARAAPNGKSYSRATEADEAFESQLLRAMGA